MLFFSNTIKLKEYRFIKRELKVKNVDLKNFHVTDAILRLWKQYKLRLCLEISLLISTKETFYRKETVGKTLGACAKKLEDFGYKCMY